jgi:hypothetical protein
VEPAAGGLGSIQNIVTVRGSVLSDSERPSYVTGLNAGLYPAGRSRCSDLVLYCLHRIKHVQFGGQSNLVMNALLSHTLMQDVLAKCITGHIVNSECDQNM